MDDNMIQIRKRRVSASERREWVDEAHVVELISFGLLHLGWTAFGFSGHVESLGS